MNYTTIVFLDMKFIIKYVQNMLHMLHFYIIVFALDQHSERIFLYMYVFIMEPGYQGL